MRKTDKKKENSVRLALTEVCEIALEEVVGFRWLTHFVDYDKFPDSLSVVCVFETKKELDTARSMQKDTLLCKLIDQKLNSAGIKVRNINKRVSFDTEEECNKINAGNWNERFR